MYMYVILFKVSASVVGVNSVVIIVDKLSNGELSNVMSLNKNTF